jgi:hypothetical protein
MALLWRAGCCLALAPSGCGVVFELTPAQSGWTEKTLHVFSGTGSDGGFPRSGVIFDVAGDLYGSNYDGAVYELSPSASGWTEQTIYSGAFSAAGGLVFDSSGNLYGTTYFGGGGNGSFSN